MSFSDFWWNGASGSGPDPELIANSLRFRGEQYLEASTAHYRGHD